MNCTNCNQKCKEHILKNLTIYFCAECWDHINYEHVPCKNHVTEFVKVINNGGSSHLKKQCPNCGQIEGKYYRKDLVEDFNSLPFADIEKSNIYQDADYEKLSEIFKRYETKRKQNKKEKSFDKFLEEHTIYLNTEEWKKRRSLVLKRDNFLCQSCLTQKATQVHHKSYRYWKNEPLFELVSVCEDCHKVITDMNRDVINFGNIIKD